MAEEYFRIGVITEAHGIKGEVKVYPTTDDVDHLKKVKDYYMSGRDGYEPLHCCGMKKQNDRIILQFREITDRDMAEKLRKRELYVDRAHAAPVEEDANLIADLIGCEARDENGSVIGTLTDVLQYGTVDTWVFRSGKESLMAPALKSVFPEVDTEKKTILVIRDRLEEVAVRS